MESSVYVGYADGAIFHTQNLASAAWVIYTPKGQVVSSRGVCLRPSSNDVVEYSTMIELLHNAISNGIPSLEAYLDFQLVVSQLNGVYQIRDPTLLRRFLRVILLERKFERITYIHIPRIYNHDSNSYGNYVLY